MDDKVNDLIDEAITALSDDSITKGADALEELAQMWAKAGMPIKSFLEVRQYIINEATAKTDALFIQEKLKIAEQNKRVTRNGTSIILN